MLPAQPNQALIDGLAVLQALAMSDQPVGSRELGRTLGLEATRVNRLLRTLAHLGLASQTSERKYVPGPAMHVLSAQSLFGSGLMHNAIGPLQELARFDMVVALGVLWRDSVCYLYHAVPGMPLAIAMGRVGLYPASKSSIGHVLLTQQSSETVRALYGEAPVPGFESVDDFLTQLDVVRTRGWAYVPHDDPTSGGTLGVAVGKPAYAAIALAGSIYESDAADYVVALKSAAQKIG